MWEMISTKDYSINEILNESSSLGKKNMISPS